MTAVDQLLAAPGVDGLRADIQVIGDLFGGMCARADVVVGRGIASFLLPMSLYSRLL
jgi:hypothetical protein